MDVNITHDEAIDARDFTVVTVVRGQEIEVVTVKPGEIVNLGHLTIREQ